MDSGCYTNTGSYKMNAWYTDLSNATAYVRRYERPNLFKKMTTNPKWQERRDYFQVKNLMTDLMQFQVCLDKNFWIFLKRGLWKYASFSIYHWISETWNLLNSFIKFSFQKLATHQRWSFKNVDPKICKQKWNSVTVFGHKHVFEVSSPVFVAIYDTLDSLDQLKKNFAII